MDDELVSTIIKIIGFVALLAILMVLVRSRIGGIFA